MSNHVELGINIDHVATLREARKSTEPDPVGAAVLAELGGADAITVHLREDRRHIQDRDVRLLRETVQVRINLEMACVEEIVRFACEIAPAQATLVPERRQEITTEGGLDVVSHRDQVEAVIGRLHDSGVSVSLFLDPDPRQIEMAVQLSADAVELHTGPYALASAMAREHELTRLLRAGALIREMGLILHAGHGLNYRNVGPIARIPEMHELNIGHSVISRAVLVGLATAVREMKDAIWRAVVEA